MPSLSPRTIFAAVVVLNFLAWSRSRYAYLPQPAPLHAHVLVKRLSHELLNPNTSLPGPLDEDQCRPLAHPILDQCIHVNRHCPESDTVLSIPYLQNYFCTQPHFRPLAFTGLVLWICFLFSTLGITASDFFTPNLATIAYLLGLDENVAGVTFLAFGNGSPDVFSTFSAMHARSGSLAIGELIGAASFIVSCVVGAMCIIKPFKVLPRPFLRDVGFFTIAVSLLLVILRDGQIQGWEAGILVWLYFVYVLTVIIGSWWERRQEWKQHTYALMRSEYQDEEPGLHRLPVQYRDPVQYRESYMVPYRDNPQDGYENLAASWPALSPSSPSGRPRSTSVVARPQRPRLQTDLHSDLHSPPSPSLYPGRQIPSFSLVGALEFRHVVAALQQKSSSPSLSMFESPVTPFAGGRYHTHSRSPRVSLTSRDGHQDHRESALGLQRLHSPASVASSEDSRRQGAQRLAVPVASSTPDVHAPSPLRLSPSPPVPSILRTPASPSNDSGSETFFEPPPRQHLLGRVAYVLFPTLHHFWEQNWFSKFASLVATPAVLLLMLTLPVVITPYVSDDGKQQRYANEDDDDDRLVDFEEEGVRRILVAEEDVLEDVHGGDMVFNKWLVACQCVCAPLLCVLVLGKGMDYQPVMFIAAAVGGLTAAILILLFAKDGDSPTSKMARCSMGFFVSIVWIMVIADEVVNVLQTFGFVFGLSDAIIGLTIFAVGNSLADLVANMSVAVFAPIMGFSACFGSPMLNILIGIGLSGSWIIHQQDGAAYEIDFSRTLFVSTVGLLLLLCATLIVVPLNGYMLTRRWGTLLVASYTVLMVVNICVELNGERTRLMN